jgi:catalase
VVSAIGFLADEMQARVFYYGNAQRYRVGLNFNHPGERAEMPVSQLSSRLADAHGQQSGWHAKLPSQQSRSVGKKPDFAEPPMP